jgi:hypothetical protein
MSYLWDGKKDFSGQIFKGNFYVDENITSLKGCPEIIKGNFYLKNSKIKNFLHSPKIIDGEMWIYYCNNLTSFYNFPEYVNKLYVSHCDNLVSLKRIKKINYMELYHCKKLKIIDNLPKKFDFIFIETKVEDINMNVVLDLIKNKQIRKLTIYGSDNFELKYKNKKKLIRKLLKYKNINNIKNLFFQ